MPRNEGLQAELGLMDLFPDESNGIIPDQLTSQLEKRLSRLEERLLRIESGLGTPSDSTSYASVKVSLDEELKKPKGMNFCLDDLLRTVVKNNASDLHIKPHSPPTARLQGDLVPIGERNLSPEECRYLVLSALPPFKRRPLASLKEVDHAYVSLGVRFRMNAFLERGHFTAALRMVNNFVPSFQDLGLPPVLSRLASLHDGLVLITGPAGSGKSTTLAALIDWINQNRRTHVVTIEDPIEYYHQDRTAFITQREVGTDTRSFLEALKQALRQDPNIIMIGEMRDAETIMTAVTAAETGHLVLSTLHTPNTIQAIDRIVDSFAGNVQKQVRTLLSTCLKGVVSQKLLNRQDTQGRIPAVEVLINTPTIASHILDGQTNEIYQYLQKGSSEGMQTFNQSLISLLDRGLINYNDAALIAERKTELRLAREQRAQRSNPATGAQNSPQARHRSSSSEGNVMDLM